VVAWLVDRAEDRVRESGSRGHKTRKNLQLVATRSALGRVWVVDGMVDLAPNLLEQNSHLDLTADGAPGLRSNEVVHTGVERLGEVPLLLVGVARDVLVAARELGLMRVKHADTAEVGDSFEEVGLGVGESSRHLRVSFSRRWSGS